MIAKSLVFRVFVLFRDFLVNSRSVSPVLKKRITSVITPLHKVKFLFTNIKRARFVKIESAKAHIVLFKIRNPSLIGIGGGLCSAFVAIQLGGYANQVLMQFPNCLTFYGGLTIVYLLPYLEPAWIEYEKKQLAEQEERKRLKLEKKLASRV